MIVSWVCILGMFIFCLSRVFKNGLGKGGSKKLKE